VLPATSVSNERSFSSMKLIKTRLRNSLKNTTLDSLMLIAIEGPAKLKDMDLAEIIHMWCYGQKEGQAQPIRRLSVLTKDEILNTYKSQLFPECESMCD
jgi:hypothetical protein